MNEDFTPPPPEQKPFSEQLPVRRRGRVLRFAILGLLWTVTLIGLLYAVENWRAKRAWKSYQADAQSQGQNWNYQDWLPAQIPEAENFAALPEVKRWADYKSPGWPGWLDNFQEASGRMERTKPDRDRAMTDLAAWSSAFEAVAESKNRSGKGNETSTNSDVNTAATAVVAALQSNESIWNRLRSEASRPQSQYSIRHNLDHPMETPLPHLGMISGHTSRLRLHASALLALGKTEDALRDIDLMQRLATSLNQETFLISQLVRSASLHRSLQPIWEGLAKRQWNPTQLLHLQRSLRNLPPAIPWKKIAEADKAMTHAQFQTMLLGSYPPAEWGTQMDFEALDLLRQAHPLIPKGWIYREQLQTMQLLDLFWSEAVSLDSEPIRTAQIDAGLAEVQKALSSSDSWDLVLSHRAFARFLFDTKQKTRTAFPLNVAAARCDLALAEVACRIEHYRLTRGSLPTTLEELKTSSPDPLPLDPLNGTPFHYQLRNRDDYLLYSVGWNQKDDHGVPSKRRLRDEEGDWVWSYPTSAVDRP